MEKYEKYSPDQLRDIWDRVGAGESVKSIARSLRREPSSLRQVLKRTGGIRPPERKRSTRCLSHAEREEISRGIAAGESLREVARRLGRSASTVSREVARNGGVKRYRATSADRRAWNEARRPKQGKLAGVRDYGEVAEKLASNGLPSRSPGGWLVPIQTIPRCT